MKYSVVIPTMWRFTPFPAFLFDLLQCPFVGEVLLYNNDSAKTPHNAPLHHAKLRHYDHGRNTFVNGPWNWGVHDSQNDNVLILNDDVIFDFKVFQRMADLVDSRIGVVGLCPGRPEYQQPEFVDGTIRILPWKPGMHIFGFGCMMFVKKSWYRPIPQELDVYFGDNWIFDTCLASGQVNYMITDMLHYTPYAATTKDQTLVGSRLAIEESIYQRELANFRRNISD